ncbi:MAG: aspartate kinase [Candidatus Omnitrophica bacterium]|nr:aspartate kinase [Candidatus Omnitrophota bacterium]
MLIIQKYGGNSLKTPQKIKAVAKRIVDLKKNNSLVIIVSALGDTTDELLSLAHQVCQKPAQREIDMLISTGEQMSSSLLAMAIHSLGKKAVSLTGSQSGIVTDNFHTRAKILAINPLRIKGLLKQGYIVVVAGFQGATLESEITTLGRGGSDLTAVALAVALKAKRCEIYTDVEGVYTADPKIVPEAKRLKEINYEEMLELSFLGAEVLQLRCVEMAEKNNIPIYVASSFNSCKGTLIK